MFHGTTDVTLDALVVGGSVAKEVFNEEVGGLTNKIAVPGVGDQAFRDRGDYQVYSLGGGSYCSVTAGGEDSIRDVSAPTSKAGGER